MWTSPWRGGRELRAAAGRSRRILGAAQKLRQFRRGLRPDQQDIARRERRRGLQLRTLLDAPIFSDHLPVVAGLKTLLDLLHNWHVGWNTERGVLPSLPNSRCR